MEIHARKHWARGCVLSGAQRRDERHVDTAVFRTPLFVCVTCSVIRVYSTITPLMSAGDADGE